ncbi:hypothetical protein B0H13DRAFT_1871925 [Mycena leptocephala]|nr:hypothetical protein B0H13DRAFT_1871925 [Mycena leptocephala]
MPRANPSHTYAASRSSSNVGVSSGTAACHAPMLLLNIRNAWTDLLLSIPAMWAAIRIATPCGEGFDKALQVWIQRARNCPLSISLCGTLERMAAVIWRHGQQLKNLGLYCDGGDGFIDILGGMSPGPLPLLETLEVGGPTVLVNIPRGYPGLQILELMRLAPNLVEYDHEKVVLLALRRLVFGPSGTCPVSDNDVLNALSVSIRDVSGDDLVSFLKRSSPPLQKLVVGEKSFRLDFPRL